MEIIKALSKLILTIIVQLILIIPRVISWCFFVIEIICKIFKQTINHFIKLMEVEILGKSK